MVVGLVTAAPFSEAEADRVFHALADSTRRDILVRAIEENAPITVELLYSDLDGRQRAITRFGLMPVQTESGDWVRITAMSRLWFLDISGPRPDSEELQSAIASVRTLTGQEPAERSGTAAA